MHRVGGGPRFAEPGFVDERVVQTQIELARRALLERDYPSAERKLAKLWEATEHVPLPRAVVGRMRRLRAAALRSLGGDEHLRKAVDILDRGLERSNRQPNKEQVAYWLDLGRTLAALGDADANNCFDMVSDDPAVLARATLERARWRVTAYGIDDKYVVRLVASALDHTIALFGDAHPFTDGVRIFAHVIELTLPPDALSTICARVMALAVREDLVTESRVVLEAALACVQARDMTRAEDFIRQAIVLERQCGTRRYRATLHALAMVLYARGRLEEAETAADQVAPPQKAYPTPTAKPPATRV